MLLRIAKLPQNAIIKVNDIFLKRRGRLEKRLVSLFLALTMILSVLLLPIMANEEIEKDA